LRDNGEALDLSALKGAQEGIVGVEGHAAVGIAVRAQHVGMREQSNPTKGEPTADGVQAQRLNPMKEGFAKPGGVAPRSRSFT
jgi:hypothetical protein